MATSTEAAIRRCSSKYCKIFKNTYFEEHLRTAASVFYLYKPNAGKWKTIDLTVRLN